MESTTNISVKRWQPDAIVPQSGVYLMHHGEQHSPAVEIVLLSGKSFPRCEVCKDEVRFELVRNAPYIFHDDDFGERDANEPRG